MSSHTEKNMYKKEFAFGTTIHLFEFDPELYFWTYEVGISQQLETLKQLAPDADYCINWSVFDWNKGKNGYGKIQNGNIILQGASKDFPTVSMVDGVLKNGDYPVANPGFARWRGLVEDSKVNLTYIVPGNYAVKDARSAIGQLTNGNIVFITVEGDDTKAKGMTGRELATYCVSLGCKFACDCDGGGSASAYAKGGYKYYQGRAIAGAMVLRKKTFIELAKSRVGCGYVLMTEGQILTKEILKNCIDVNGANHYYFDGYNAEKWLGKQVFDCSGLIVWALRKLGLSQERYRSWDLYALCVVKTAPSEGDLCFNADLSHVGIYIGNGQYLQAKGTKDGVVISDRYNFSRFGTLKLPSGGGNMDLIIAQKAIDFVKTFQAASANFISKTEALSVDGDAGTLTKKKLNEVIRNEAALKNLIEGVK